MTVKDAKPRTAAALQGAESGPSGEAAEAALIRELAGLLTETGLSEIEVERDGVRVRVCRQAEAAGAPVVVQSAALQANEAPRAREGHAAGTVTSPMVGTVYVSPSPGSAPFVKVGDAVNEGDTLLIVEAMKTMNPILAPKSGTVTEICIHDSEPVEFGQALLVLD